MAQSRDKPDYSTLVDYNYAVAGHAGTMCDADGCMFVKPCTQREVDFYETARSNHPDFYDLMPEYMGTVTLSDATAVAAELPVMEKHAGEEVNQVLLAATKARRDSLAQVPKDNITWVPNGGKKIATDLGICLDNATYGFKRPNILDVKLGVRLWADDAPLQKKQRFDQITATTTHGDLGFRISGMRAYKGSKNEADLDGDQYKIYDKDYGKRDVTSKNIVEAFRAFIFNEAAGIDEPLGKAVAEVFLKDLQRVKSVLEREESRMYSSSLLFVFEGDGDALRGLIEEHNADAVGRQRRADGAKASLSTVRVDSGIEDMDYDGELIDSESDDEFVTRPWTLKLIDFAHADFTPGLGPDENTLKGVRSLIDIFSELAN